MVAGVNSIQKFLYAVQGIEQGASARRTQQPETGALAGGNPFATQTGIYNGGNPIADTTGGSTGYNAPGRKLMANHLAWA